MDSAGQHAEPITNIVGDKVALGPLHRDLLPLCQKWLNDFDVTRTLAVQMRSRTLETEEAWYERITRSQSDVVFAVFERAGMHPVGYTGLHHIDHFNRIADFRVVIGEKEYWDRGLGTEVTTLMLDYGFTALNLHNILLQTYDFNERGLRAYVRAGFQIVGRRREAHRLSGRAYDIVLMDCLASEFQGRVPAERPGARRRSPG